MDASRVAEIDAEGRSHFQKNDFPIARRVYENLLRESVNDSVKRNCSINIASCYAAEGNLDQAMRMYLQLDAPTAPDNHVLYNMALCHYECGDYVRSIKLVDQLVERCEKFSPELFHLDERHLFEQNDKQALGQLEKLHYSCLIEALNLKSALVYKSTNDSSLARKVLERSPVQAIDLLDCVTLHNSAIYQSSTSSTLHNRLSYLIDLSQNSQDDTFKCTVPLEARTNMINIALEKCDHESAMDILSKINSHSEYRMSDTSLALYAILLDRTLPEDKIYLKLDQLLSDLQAKIRKCDEGNGDAKSSLRERHSLVELAVTVICHQTSILWNNNQYLMLEKLLRKVKFIFDTYDENLWIENMAHALFMQDTRYEECSLLYESLLPKEDDESILGVDATVLSNLCVSYVLSGRNGDAEELIKEIEEEESISEKEEGRGALRLLVTATSGSQPAANSQDKLRFQTDARSQRDSASHLSIINLAIETLYCVKSNYEFGLTRMFKTLEPLEKKLNSHVWFQVKRCILSLLDNHCRQLIYIRDDLLNQTAAFLIECELHGHAIEATPIAITSRNFFEDDPRRSKSAMSAGLRIDPVGINHDQSAESKTSVSSEARYLRCLILALLHD